MYLAVNLPLHIATFGSVLLLTASHMISQLLKCTGNPRLIHLSLKLEILDIVKGVKVDLSFIPFLKPIAGFHFRHL